MFGLSRCGSFHQTCLFILSLADTYLYINKQFLWDSRLYLKVGFPIPSSVFSPIAWFFFYGEPYERGFFCNDESLMHPYHKSTVRHWHLYVFGLIMPVSLVSFFETNLNLSVYNKPIWGTSKFRNFISIAFVHCMLPGFYCRAHSGEVES